jgi:hypothetical protein
MFKTKSNYPEYSEFTEKNKLTLRQLFINKGSNNDNNPKIITKRNTPLDSYFTFNKPKTNINLGTKISYEDYLLKKLSYFRKINRELNSQINNISEKAKLLFNDITKNRNEYLNLEKECENEIKLNKEMKSQFKKNLINIEKEKEINELKEEQNILLMNLKSKDKIINNLKNTLNVITKEIDEDKQINENIMNQKYNQINELKKILNDLNNKFEKNKKIINSKKKEKLMIKNESQNNNLIDENNDDLDENEIKETKEKNKNIKNYKRDLKIENEDNHGLTRNNKINNFPKEQRLLTITEKSDNYSSLSENYFPKLSLINAHKRSKSNEIDPKKYIEDIDNKIYSFTEGNMIKDISTSKTNNMNKDSFYLYTITKEGELLEFDLIEKKYKLIVTNQIKDWKIFIQEYISFHEGSLLLNTFQGLFILTGKNHNNLFYYSKKYNSISKISTFNSSHKYGGLILTPNCENIIAIGGETREVEILNIENGQIQKLPNLLTKRINSAFCFIGNKLFALFGKFNNQIELLDIINKKNWELIKLKKHDNKMLTFEGLAGIPIAKNEILFVGNINNNKLMKFNYEKMSIEYEDIDIQNKNKYSFDKDKYFNNFINFEKVGKDGNYLNQFVGIDSKGNIHYFNSDFTYSIINYEQEQI